MTHLFEDVAYSDGFIFGDLTNNLINHKDANDISMGQLPIGRNLNSIPVAFKYCGTVLQRVAYSALEVALSI